MSATTDATQDPVPQLGTRPELSAFESEYFIQTRKEIDTEKHERNKILNYAILATGAMSVAFARSGSLSDLASPAALVIYFPLLILVSVLVAARRIKLRQISDRWHALGSLLHARGCVDGWAPLEDVVCRGLRGRRYLAEDFLLHLGLSSVVYCLIIAVAVHLVTATPPVFGPAVGAGLGVLAHFGVTSFWLSRRLRIPLEYQEGQQAKQADVESAA